MESRAGAEEHSLLLLLGRGQKVLTDWDDAGYRQANYYLVGNDDRVYTTPFVGEALVHLLPQQFTRVYVFGTSGSMWEVLLAHCLQRTDLGKDSFWIEMYHALARKVRDQSLKAGDSYFRWVGQALQRLFQLPVECYLIELGRNAEEIWRTFGTLMSLDIPAGKLSIDITHGLRNQPFFLYLTLLYYQALLRNVEIESIYYGALELTQDGKTPIFNLRELLEMTRWILAVYSFMNYGDARPVIELFPREISSDALETLKQAALRFTSNLQVNLLGRMREYSRDLLAAYDEAKTDPRFPRPLKFLERAFLELPLELEQKGVSKWRAILKIARYHWEHNRPGLSILALWEAVVERLGALYEMNPDKADSYQKIGEMIVSAQPRADIDPPLQQLIEHLQELKQIRNLVAHADQERMLEIDAFLQRYPTVLQACEELLDHEDLVKVYRLD